MTVTFSLQRKHLTSAGLLFLGSFLPLALLCATFSVCRLLYPASGSFLGTAEPVLCFVAAFLLGIFWARHAARRWESGFGVVFLLAALLMLVWSLLCFGLENQIWAYLDGLFVPPEQAITLVRQLAFRFVGSLVYKDICIYAALALLTCLLCFVLQRMWHRKRQSKRASAFL